MALFWKSFTLPPNKFKIFLNEHNKILNSPKIKKINKERTLDDIISESFQESLDFTKRCGVYITTITDNNIFKFKELPISEDRYDCEEFCDYDDEHYYSEYEEYETDYESDESSDDDDYITEDF